MTSPALILSQGAILDLYQSLITAQRLETDQRFIDELPVLEAVAADEEKRTHDLSEIEIAVLFCCPPEKTIQRTRRTSP